MVSPAYSTGRLAGMSGVSVRTSRYYDHAGLLHPSSVTKAGHRRYTDNDLIRLQQVLALNFLGFSLDQVREMVEASRMDLHDT